jgi:hypothetical protein
MGAEAYKEINTTMGMSERYKQSGNNEVTSQFYGAKKLTEVKDERLIDLIRGTKDAIVREEKFLWEHKFDKLENGEKYKEKVKNKIRALKNRLIEFEIERVRRGI